MYFDSIKVTAFCIKHKITIAQLYVATLLYRQNTAELMAYGNEVTMFSEEDLQGLVKKGLVLDLNKDGEFYPDNFVVTDTFIESTGVEVDSLADELWDAYPHWVSVGDKRFKGRNVSPEELESMLNAKLVRGRLQPKEFRGVIDSVIRQSEDGQLGMALRAWIDNEGWKLEEDNVAEHGNDL